MEFLIEELLNLIFEGSIEISSNKKVSKWIRYPLIVIIILFFSVIILSIFGLIMIYSASSVWANYKFNDSFHYFKYQLVFLIIGIILMKS